MGQVGDLIGAQGTAAAGVFGPAEHPRLEESAIDDQLTAALEQIEQAYLALGSVELVLLVHSQPRHPPAFGGERVTGAGEGLFLHEEFLARRLPLMLRHDRGCVHRFPVFLVSLFACCHVVSPLFSETDRVHGSHTNTDADIERAESNKCGGIPMDSLTAARALAEAGNPVRLSHRTGTLALV